MIKNFIYPSYKLKYILNSIGCQTFVSREVFGEYALKRYLAALIFKPSLFIPTQPLTAGGKKWH